MNIEFVSRNCQLDDEVRSLTDSRLRKVVRFLDEPVDVHLTLDVEKRRHIAELQIKHRHGNLQAHEEGASLRESIGLAIEKIEKQARRSHKKHHQGRRRGAKPQAMPGTGTEGQGPQIIEKSMQQIKPMSIDEAAMQLDESRLEFLVFRDAEMDQIAVLYRRRDGNLGLINTQS